MDKFYAYQDLFYSSLWQAVVRVAALRRGLGAVYEAMPRDLQQTMLSSPARAALLQSLSLHIRVPGQPSRNRMPERRTL